MRRLTVKRPDGRLLMAVALLSEGPKFTVWGDGAFTWEGDPPEPEIFPPYIVEVTDTEAATEGGSSGG